MSDVVEHDEPVCPFCGRDPYHYVHNGVGVEPVAVTCCDLGISLFQDGDEKLVSVAERMEKAAARIEQLEAENASLASWQCEFTDGKTGLVYGEGGSTYCAMAKEVERLRAEVKVWQGHAKTAIWSDSEECKFLTARIERLEKALEAWNSAVRVDVLMEGPRYMGVSGEAGRRAWELTRAALEDT